MFTKLKQKVTEQSKSEFTSLVTATSESPLLLAKSIAVSKETSGESISSKKSTSDDNQSSDEIASVTNSQTSKQININDCGEDVDDALNLNNKHDTRLDKSSFQLSDENFHDEKSIKSQFYELNQSLLKQVDELTNELNEKLTENEEIRSEFLKLTNKLEESQILVEKYKLELENQKEVILNQELEIKLLNNDKSNLLMDNEKLSEKYEILKHNQSNLNIDNNQDSISSSNESFIKTSPFNDPSKISSNKSEITALSIDEVCNFKQSDEIKCLHEEINEKNKTIKNLQQRLNDMKKTLQKEFKCQNLSNEQKIKDSTCSSTIQDQEICPNNENKINNEKSFLINNSNSISVTSNNIPNKHNLKKSSSANVNSSNGIEAVHPKKSNSHLSTLHDDVNFKYLKHVILKFLTSREYEAFHLIKALSVLLNFTNDEEKILKETLQWKMSWFGSRPNVKV